MKVKDKKEIVENGVVYIVETYSNGVEVKYIKGNDAVNNMVEPEPHPLSEQEQIAIDTALNVEYIACLLESNM